jgi:DNA-binding LacI/PurR family transcriptional regulator
MLRGGRRADEAAESIRRHIIRHCQSGELLPSERDWAERLGVSRQTVRNALANLAYQGWVTKRPGQGFRVSSFHRKLTGATGVFFLAEPGHLLLDPFYRQLFLGVTEVASGSERGLINFFGRSRRSSSVTPTSFWKPNLRAVDSLLFLRLFNQEIIAHAAQVHPVVCLDVDYEIPGVSFASFDHVQSLKLAVKYLVDLGHRRIGYIGRTASSDPAVGARVAGYRQALEWAGLVNEESWLMPTCTQQAPESIVERWSRMPARRRPTALIAGDCFWSIMAWATQMGVEVPDRLSILAIGAPQTWNEFVQLQQAQSELADWQNSRMGPILSSDSLNARMTAVRPTMIDLPAREMGQWGMREVLRRTSEPASDPRRELFGPTLLPGDTAGRLTAG